MELDATAQLLAAVAGAGALVSGLVAAVKGLAFPPAWQHGRAPMILAAVLAGVFVLAAWLGMTGAQLTPAAIPAVLAAWLTVYQAAIGTHQTVTKAGRVLTGSTDPSGPDAG